MASDDTHGNLLGQGLGEDDARTHLERAEFGVLGLTKEGEAYTFPISFGFDADVSTLYFLFEFDGESKKREFVDTTETASFVVVESELPDAWASVILTGEISKLSADESTAYMALANTACFPALNTFEDYVNMETTEHTFYQFDVETITARQSPTQLADTEEMAKEADPMS